MKLLLTLAACAGSLLLGACHSPQASDDASSTASSPATASTAANTPATARTFVYQCEDLAVTAHFVGQNRVDLSWSGKQLSLPSAVSADGARYADEKGNEFWGKGMTEAMFTVAGEKLRNCTSDGKPVALEAAEGQLNFATDQSGALSTQFHATGSEPGWLATVSLGDAPSLHVEMNYGERKLDVAPATNADDHWTGKAGDGTDVTLAFARTPCTDAMSGAQAPATVVLNVGGETLHGCGGFRTP